MNFEKCFQKPLGPLLGMNTPKSISLPKIIPLKQLPQNTTQTIHCFRNMPAYGENNAGKMNAKVLIDHESNQKSNNQNENRYD